MLITVRPLSLTKRLPLTISRGTSAGSQNLRVEVSHDGISGIGEMAPVNIGDGAEDAVSGAADLAQWSEVLSDVAPWEMQRVERILDETGGGHAVRAGLDMALYDWLGKRAEMSLYRLFGLDPARIVATSVTVGINPPEVVRERIPELMARLSPKTLKVKLGQPGGLDADREMFEVVREVAPRGVGLRVDANGGWTVEGARKMIAWLAERGVEYVEQPLPLGQEEDLPAVHRDSPLPLFADESCRVATDVPKLADRVDGINLKLMKAGGIREGLRVIHTARAHGLKVMMGCMSESSLAISASVALSPLADYLDLDSQLNLLPDPFIGLVWKDGRVLPGEEPGLGVRAATAAFG
jgi:L-Ala-D/L-Glu epimerase